MKPIKVVEIKVTGAGREVFLLTPDSATVVAGGKSFEVPEKLAKALFKAVAVPAKKFCNELRDHKP